MDPGIGNVRDIVDDHPLDQKIAYAERLPIAGGIRRRVVQLPDDAVSVDVVVRCPAAGAQAQRRADCRKHRRTDRAGARPGRRQMRSQFGVVA
ncbi:hypothetical protein [Burkholderia ubonensis]|uniref:hypothetical protein n=1 Tax=Burkholderia ubonensis TaxID=101571 RepID=UPI0012F8703A|nr:hypothetical protein [Burkholderia ubonensis]